MPTVRYLLAKEADKIDGTKVQSEFDGRIFCMSSQYETEISTLIQGADLSEWECIVQIIIYGTRPNIQELLDFGGNPIKGVESFISRKNLELALPSEETDDTDSEWLVQLLDKGRVISELRAELAEVNARLENLARVRESDREHIQNLQRQVAELSGE